MRLLTELLVQSEEISEEVRLELLSELLAAQALALAAYKRKPIENVSDAWSLVEEAASYPGVTMRPIKAGGISIGERAMKRLCNLAGFSALDRP